MANDSALMLLLIKYMERSRVGFGRTVCTLVLVHVWIQVLLLSVIAWYDPLNITPSQLHTRLLFNYNGDGIWTRADVNDDWIWNCIVLVLDDRTYVCIGACLNLNLWLLGIRCTMTPSRLHTRLLINYNGNDTRLCADVDVDWIYGTVSCWLWTDRM